MNEDKGLSEIEDILPRIKNILLNIYGARLVDVFLYGSFAKNTFTEESDIDIAVILKGRVDKTKEIDKIYEHLYKLELDTNELISVHPISCEEFENSSWPLFYHIKKEGIRI